MKSIVIAGVIALLVVTLCISGIAYVSHAVTDMDAYLVTCIQTAQDPRQAKSALAQANQAWEAHRGILMMYTDQELLDEIDDHLVHLQALLDHHPEDFVPTAVLCRGRLQELKQREAISLYSWF